MITTLEIIERSIYDALLRTALKLKYTIDPLNYYPITPDSERQYQADVNSLDRYIMIYGAGNTDSKGKKITPRIVVESQGFYPGNIGMPGQVNSREGPDYVVTEVANETLDSFINVRLVSNNQTDNRILHNILHQSLPQKGYIKPFYAESLLSTGNIFMEVVNFSNEPDMSKGLIEKVYEFAIYDCLIEIPTDIESITPIRNISIDFEDKFNINVE